MKSLRYIGPTAPRVPVLSLCGRPRWSLRLGRTKRFATMASSLFTVPSTGARPTGLRSRCLWSQRCGSTPLHAVFAAWNTNIHCEPTWIPPPLIRREIAEPVARSLQARFD